MNGLTLPKSTFFDLVMIPWEELKNTKIVDTLLNMFFYQVAHNIQRIIDFYRFPPFEKGDTQKV